MSDTLRCDYLPGCQYQIWQDNTQFCFTTDAVFLGNFPHIVNKCRALELGCGTGAISMYLAARGAQQITAVDLNPVITELFRKSVAVNALDSKITVVDGDIKDYKRLFQAGSMDLVVANPPYRNSGDKRKVGTAACHEVTANLEDFFQAAAYACRFRGRFALVQLPERFVESIELARKYGFQPKKLQWVHSKMERPAWIFMMEMVKGGSYGLDVLPPLIMYNEDGTYATSVKSFFESEIESNAE